jgi:hypothetical protein
MEEAERLYRQVAQTAPDSDAGRQARDSLATMHEVEAPAPAAGAPSPATRAPAVPAQPASTPPHR